MNFTNILASVSVGVVDRVDTLPGEWISIPFNLFVESGDVLAVVVSGYTQGGVFPLQPPDVVFWVAGPDSYDEGSAWTRATGGTPFSVTWHQSTAVEDRSLRVYPDAVSGVPEPGSLALLPIAFAWFCTRTRGRDTQRERHHHVVSP